MVEIYIVYFFMFKHFIIIVSLDTQYRSQIESRNPISVGSKRRPPAGCMLTALRHRATEVIW